MRIRDASGTLRTITQIRLRDASGTLRTVTQVHLRDAGAILRNVFNTLSASISATYVSGTTSGISAYHGSVTSIPGTTATAVGGVGPFTYAWEYVSGDPSVTPDDPTFNTTTFTGDVYEGAVDTFFRCKITDSLGHEAYTPNIQVHLRFIAH